MEFVGEPFKYPRSPEISDRWGASGGLRLRRDKGGPEGNLRAPLAKTAFDIMSWRNSVDKGNGHWRHAVRINEVMIKIPGLRLDARGGLLKSNMKLSHT